MFPNVKGVNNHMGSKLTASSEQMRQIFTILKKRNLFFVDSRTSAETLCRPSAELLQLPFAERDVFIDHEQTPVLCQKTAQTAGQTGPPPGVRHRHRPSPPGYPRGVDGNAAGTEKCGLFYPCFDSGGLSAGLRTAKNDHSPRCAAAVATTVTIEHPFTLTRCTPRSGSLCNTFRTPVWLPAFMEGPEWRSDDESVFRGHV
jgi:hypothetical protein